MVRKTFHWILILLALAAVGGGVAAWYVWVEADSYARTELERRLSEIGPSCELQIGKVRFDWDRLIHVYDFAVRAKGKQAPPTFAVPEAVLQIDRERFLDSQTVDVQMIRLIRPTLDVTRRADGTWTVEDLLPFRLDPTLAVPEWQIEDATIRFRIEQPQGKPVVLVLQNADLRLVPAGKRQLIIRGLSDVSDAGPLQVSGRLDLDRGTWSLAGSVNGLNTSGDIAGFVLGSSAELQDQVASLRHKLRDAEQTLLADDESSRSPAEVPFRTVSRSRGVTGRNDVSLPDPRDAAASAATSHEAPRDLTGLGINATLDLSFAFARREEAAAADYKVQVKCKDGQIVNPLLPFALRHLRGDLYWDNTSLKLTSFQADGAGTVLKVDGGFQLGGPTATGHVAVGITDLNVSDTYSGDLPPAVERFLNAIRPSGPVDVAGTFDRDDAGSWSVRDFLLTAKGATAIPEPFPIPIRDVTGTVRQVAPGRFEAAMTGRIGARPVRLVAKTRSAEGGPEVGVQINAEAVPLDDAFRDACNEKTQAVLTELGLEGNADVEVHLYRQAGPERPLAWWFKAHVTGGELEYALFPYRLSQLTGDVSYNSENRLLRFWNVAGQHGRATVRGEGTYCAPPEVGPDGTAPLGIMRPGLSLALTGEQVGLGDDLQAALPVTLKQVWEELNLEGTAGLAVNVSWVPGSEPRIELPRIDITDGALNIRDFPYSLHTIEAKARYTPEGTATIDGRTQPVPAKVTIRDFVGWHDGGVRVGATDVAVSLLPDRSWQLELPALSIEDLTLDPEFRRAAPEALRKAIESLDLQGQIDVSGRVAFQGSRTPRAPFEAEWNLSGKLVDATIKAGLEATNVTGTVNCRGSDRNGEVEVSGRVDLDQARVYGQRLENVRGPFALKDGQIEIGSTVALGNGRGSNSELSVPIEDRLTATYLDPGLVTLDAVVTTGTPQTYRGRVTLTGGSLERYTQSQPGSGQRKLAGAMNGWVDFQGQGTSAAGVVGQGQLRINPAELYELPVVMQMFNALFPVPPDNTAFHSARLDFTIRDAMFLFDRRQGIVLNGDALRLIGGGTVNFDGVLKLELYTTLPRNPVKAVSAVPLIGPLVGQVVGGVVDAATTGWVSVVVEGTTADPVARNVPLKALPDGVRAIFDSVTPPRPTPRTAVLPGRRR